MTDTSTGVPGTDQAREAGTQAKEKVQEAGQQARGRVRDEVDRRSTQAGEQAGAAADAVRQAADHLRGQGNEPVAKGMEQVATRVERAGGWLRDSDGDSILRDVEDFGRRNPLAVVAGGVAIGFAASRLLKASSRSRYEGTDNGAPQLQPAGATTAPPSTATPPSTVTPPPTTPGAPATDPLRP
jgi:hypothetical protein